MSYEFFLVREDNKTLFEIGSRKSGLAEVVSSVLSHRRSRRYGCLLSERTAVLVAGFDTMIAALQKDGLWEKGDFSEYTKVLAERVTRWAGEMPIRVVGEVEGHPLQDDGYKVTDNRYESDWPQFDKARANVPGR